MSILILLLIFHCRTLVNSLELKGINSCQTSLLANSKILTSSSNMIFNTWCPSSFDTEPSILISLPNITYITRLQIKSLYSHYHLDYTRDDSIDQSNIWRSYRLLTTKDDDLSLDPPIIAKHIRLNLKPAKHNFCLQLEFFGCVFTDGVVSYNMLQGSHLLEDDIYDGQYNEKHRYLYDGLGQLSDGQTGPDNHDDAQGFQWVGWRKPRYSKDNYSIEILFTFDRLRNFSRLTIHANNYYPRKIYVFRSITIEFLNKNHSSSMLTYDHQRDDQFEMARPIMIDLKHHIASQLKIHLYFDSNWILISEFTFDSLIIPSPSIIIQSPSIHFSIYVLICLSMMMMIILILPIIIMFLIRNLLKNKKTYFTPINSSVSTASSEIDTSSSHHRYATIGYSPYVKLIPTTNLLRSPLTMQQNHIEGICGNSSYSTQRSFTFNLNPNLFIPNEKIHIKNRIENRHQLLGGGEIYQGELQINQTLIPVNIRRLLPNVSVQSKISFLNELSLLTSLCHPHILHAYGFCAEPSLSLLIESSDDTTMDLYQYLQQSRQEQPLYSTVFFFGSQICSALVYLESLHIYHRDIAARNCLISSNLNIKLQDLAMCNEIYADDYVLITIENEIQTRRPIRWCAWETVCLNRFTSKSDVFSFGVLLWEILTFAERPHSLFDDEQVLSNLRNSIHCLMIPAHGGDLRDLISACWNKYDYDRPSFSQLNHFFNEKRQLLTIQSENNNNNNYQHILI